MPPEGLPSGRERAIETLIDSEPNGACYRASRILDEVVPQALANRPNLITRSALVEQAHSLSKYEVDSAEKYKEAFGVELDDDDDDDDDDGIQDDDGTHVDVNADVNVNVDVHVHVHAHVEDAIHVHGTHTQDVTTPKGKPALTTTPTKPKRRHAHYSRSTSIRNCDEDDEISDRILRHHETICSTTLVESRPSRLVSTLQHLYGKKNSNNSSNNDNDNDNENTSYLLPSVLRHDALETNQYRRHDTIVSSDENDSNEEEEEEEEDALDEEENTRGILEAIIGNVCRDLGDDDSLHGLLLAILSVLTCLDGRHDDDDVQQQHKQQKVSGKSSTRTDSILERRPHQQQQRDPTDMPALQVGAILSLLQSSSSSSSPDGPFALDEDVLQYLGQAASVYEERIEIQKSRLLARMLQEEAKRVVSDDKQEDAHDNSDNVIVPIVPLTPTEGSGAAVVEDDDDHDDDENDDDDALEVAEAQVDDDADDDDDDDDDDDLPGDDSALSAAVFDQIISAVTGDDMSLDGVDRAALRLAAGGLRDSSDDDSDEESDDDPQQHYDAPHVEDDSSSDPEVADDDEDDDDEDDDDEPHIEDEDEDQEHETILREALALSLADRSGFPAPETGSDENDEEEPVDDEDGLLTPRRQSTASSRKSGEVDTDDPTDGDEPLPELPQAPAHYPYWSSVDTVADVDERKDPAKNLHPCLDPSSLSRFGSIPASFTIVRLLHNALATVTSLRVMDEKRKKEPKHGFKANSVPGGMGCTLFGSEPHLFAEQKDKDSDDEVGSSAVSIQLLVAALLLFFDARKDAIEGLRAAVLAEQRNAQGDDGEHVDDDDDDDDEIGDGNDTPLSDDEEEHISDAIGMTLNYPSDNAASMRSSQADSLESKGMTRKAAAAGWDAAMRIKSLKKNTDAWKIRVQLYSYCTLLAMKCFRTFVQSCVAERLDVRINSAEEMGSSFLNRLKRVIPAAVSSKLSDALSVLLSVVEFRTLLTLVSGDDAGEVEDVFMPLNLYREALATWGESVPLLHPSPSNRELVLRTLIKDCFSKARTVHHFGSFDTIFSLPSTEDESQLYKLDILCRRFCVTDLLDDVVSRPLCFNPELQEGSDDEDVEVAVVEQQPKTASTLASLLYSSSLKTSGACLRFLRRLNMAICHRCNVRGILWDGLYACSQFEAHEVSNLPASTTGAESIRVSSNPSSSLLFDSTKCSDSIAILSSQADAPASSNGSSGHQRASKVWGTVISASCYVPKSGVHRWAVRLDRCERGHVFVGVATTQASMRTYVGGDKYGWGVIGTQALWHDRRKIRGDYGATFRTGSVIVVTLDTDAGTLSFSSWKDTNSSAGSFSLDPLFSGLTSPRRQAPGGGALEEWGVAFEGLPLDAKLYPAVGLYQRDDRVTLLGVESGGRVGGQSTSVDGELFSGGTGYFPRLREPQRPISENFVDQMSSIRNHNNFLSWDSIGFVDSMLTNVVDSIKSGDASQLNLSLHTILPSVASSICLLPPSIPVLSARFALQLLPKLTDCIHSLDQMIEREQRLFSTQMKGGKWLIRATGPSGSSASSEFEEYVVTFKNKHGENGEFVGFFGNGIGTTGKSKNGIVSIVGTMQGSSIHLFEEWADGVEEGSPSSSAEEASSSCVVSARLSLDGFKFEGTYRNIQYGSTGHIAALCLSEGDPPSITEVISTKNATLRSQSLLRLAHGHLATILGNDDAGDHSPHAEQGEVEKHNRMIRSFLSCSPFSEGLHDANGDLVDKTLESLRELYDGPGRISGLLQSQSIVTTDTSGVIHTSPNIDDVAKLDKELAAKNGGCGSLNALCSESYTAARLQVIAALVHHCSLHEKLKTSEDNSLDEVWRTALTITESQVRAALSDDSVAGSSMKERSIERCRHVVDVSHFLLSLQPNTETQTKAKVVSDCLSLFYTAVRSKDDLAILDKEFIASRRRACLKLVALKQLEEVLPGPGAKLDVTKSAAIECTSVAIPRILGRGWSNKVNSPSCELSAMDIGHHYLSGLPGAGQALRNSVRSSVHSILSNLGNVMKQVCATEMAGDQDSVLLSILPVFACSIRPNDIENVVVQSKVLESLSHILSHHRGTLRTKCSHPRASVEADRSLQVNEMKEIVERDVSRAVVRAATSVSHAIAYQLTQWTDTRSTVRPVSVTADALDQSVTFLKNELKDFVPFMEMILREDLESYLITQGHNQYTKWSSVSMPESLENEKTKKKKSPAKPGRSSLSQLLERGTLVMPRVSTASPSKSGSKATVSSTSTCSGGVHREKFTFHSGMACQHHLSRCLDILNCLTRSPEAVSALVKSDSWLDVIFAPIGLSMLRGHGGKFIGVELTPAGSNVPARYRARLIRFLPNILSHAAANKFVVEGLFLLGGLANGIDTNSLHGDESLVAGEVTACLRGLYSAQCHEWKNCIDHAITQNAGNNEQLSTGILAFVGGSIRTLGPGSHVLLKPAAAAPLSPDAQSAPSSKSSGSSGSGSSGAAGGVNSHHVVGTGTEGIVAGLCRAEAGAGVVSSVDMKTGICEVILIERSSEQRLLLNHQRSLTVRALRSPLAEVAQAEQIPLALGPSFPVVAFLNGTLPSAFALFGELPNVSGTDETVLQQQARIRPFHKSLLALRAAIVLLSDDRVLHEFSTDEGCRDILSNLLCLAGKQNGLPAKVAEAVKLESLASLPVHEGKFHHFARMLAELQVRQAMLESTSDDIWNQRESEWMALGNTKAIIEEVEMVQDSSESSDANAATRSDSLGGSSSVRESEAPNSTTRGTAAPSRRTMSQSSVSSNSTEDEEESEAAVTAAAHLREAAIAQMAELGLPRSWSELALRRTGGVNIEAAVHFCLERGGDMERLLAEERERERMMQRSSTSSRRRGNRSERSSQLLRQLLEMGFPSRWCAEALTATQNNVDEALTWILTNSERLSAEDEGMADEDDADEDFDDEEDDDEDDEDEDDAEQEPSQPHDEEPTNQQEAESSTDDVQTQEVSLAQEEATPLSSNEEEKEDELAGWCGSVTPLRFISGRSIINPKTLSISGLPTGGFSSVGTKGVLLTSGKWYYEAILETAGCLQIGWADGSFSGHCHAERGDGCGDGPSSWAYDGWRRYRWHASATEWGCRWKEGDVVGCLADMDERSVSFTLNGKSEEVGMGAAFSGQGFRPCGGVYACVSFNRKEKLRLILGGKGTEPFKYNPPEGYRGVGDAVLQAVKARDTLLSRESILSEQNSAEDSELGNRFLCDFSDGEHGHELFAWQHRYYGSDASVHLGSGRSTKPSSGSGKSAAGSGSTGHTSPLACVSVCVEKEWRSKQGFEEAKEDVSEAPNVAKTRMSEGLQNVAKKLGHDAVNEALLLGILYSRKLILHLIITFGKEFRLGLFDRKGEVDAARDFWRVIDTCVSLRSAGWVGEAGAMAVAAEALGLGISSTENQSRTQLSDRPGISSVVCGDETILLPVAGISQLLSTIAICKSADSSVDRETWQNLAACAEASIGADGGGGPLVFLQQGLQSALCKSKALRDVLVAIIRRSVRLLAVVDYSGDDSSASENADEDDMDASSKRAGEAQEAEESAKAQQPDARLTCFLTGLLLSAPVQACVSDNQTLHEDLLEAWSVGLLSASAPWRMVCALTTSGILNECPAALQKVVQSISTVASFYRRLPSTVLRRVWAERAATPVCSRYVQALIELLASVRRAEPAAPSLLWGQLAVDASTPLPLDTSPFNAEMTKRTISPNWEWDEGWVANDAGWEVWVGKVECMVVDWKTPSRSAVRTLMDGGDGPPMLREGCAVMRGLDWDDFPKTGDEDGKKQYESEKAVREKEKKALEEQAADDPAEPGPDAGDVSNDEQTDPATSEESEDQDAKSKSESSKKKKRKRIPNPKLPTGTVISVEPWNGISGMARRVRWNLTGEEGIYRYGGDGGRFDICHVEVNEKGTRIRKRHPLPESAEQCAARHGFGSGKKHSVLLRLRRLGIEKDAEKGDTECHHEGVLEWPDFGAGVKVNCVQYPDGAVLVQEKELLFGSKDAGWEARFGQPSYTPGTEIMLTPTGSSSLKDMVEVDTRSSFMSAYQELLGSTSYVVDGLRNRSDGSKVRVTLEMKMLRGRRPKKNVNLPPSLEYTARPPPPMCFDRDYHASSMSLSKDGRTLTCVSPDGRGTAFAGVGFTKGVHYWEVKLEQADIGSVFIGVAEKPNTSSASGGSAHGDSPPRLNRWLGWGFVNFRATYTAGAERVYGAHCHNEDTVGVLLDCDAGRVSFFYDGMKYGEHILNDLGCAFENISPFGFNADGCGSGGAGQGAPSGIEGGRGGRYPAHGVVRPRALWPVIGLRNPGDRITMSTKWSSSGGVDAAGALKNVLAVDELLAQYSNGVPKANISKQVPVPDWFVREAFDEYRRWYSHRWYKTTTRGSGPHRLATFGLDIELDTSPFACAAACASIGLRHALLAGDRVVVKRSAGRPLELAEEAIVLGAHQCRLYYRIVAQKSEGGSLMEGGGRAWFWDESEVVGDSLQLVGEGKSGGTELPLIDRFRCLSSGGIKIVYEGGAVVRSDLEIIDRSSNLGSVPHDTVIPRKDILERRVNSCGVIRYRITYEGVGEGWISSRIRGGKEESILEAVHDTAKEKEIESSFRSPEEAAMAWYQKMEEVNPDAIKSEDLMYKIGDVEEFKDLLSEGQIQGMTSLESDSIVATLVTTIADFSEDGDAVECSFSSMLSAVKYAMASSKDEKIAIEAVVSAGPNQAAAAVLASAGGKFASDKALLARIALLRALNRRVRKALPWLSARPSQEGTAILGGLCGQGASVERAGRSKLVDSMERWVQVRCIASRVRSLRSLIFSSVKLEFLEGVTHATTTPTPLSHDEYELPREIRTVRVNRLKARRAMAGANGRLKRKHSVFSQLQNETRSWGGAALRRGFVAKGHGGQKRAFKVKLIGEGVNDYSGPYREVFTDAIHEVLEFSDGGRGSLGVLDPTPNNASQIGDDRELFMFSSGERKVPERRQIVEGCSEEEQRIRKSFSSLTMARDESSREVEESLVFLGRLVGTACRHGIPVDLPLPMSVVWSAVAEERIDSLSSLREIDLLASKNADGSLLWWQQRMLNSFVDGLSHLLPVELLPILSGEELRALLCGNPDVDVDLLKQVVEYEGYEETDDVISYFWEALREMCNDDRKKFLQFVWARNRLPNKASDFDAPFKIMKGGGDDTLPSASTCFFSLTLPEYSSKEVLKDKLTFAFENVCTMESDYVTNDAEVGEGWRGV